MMLPITQKLNSKRGASMIMAMVFLLFCLLIGGSVYASATANGSRIENMTGNQQEYYSQRSAMMLMADMLKDKDGKELQVTVTEVTVTNGNESPERTIRFSCPGLKKDESGISFLQQILLKYVVASHYEEGVKLDYSVFGWDSPTDFLGVSAQGDIYAACTVDLRDYLIVDYKINPQDYSMEFDFDNDQSYFVLKMDSSVNTGTPKTVTVDDVETTTTTTVIRWNLPEIQKIQHTAGNQTGGN